MSYPLKISRVFVYPCVPSLRVRVQEGYKICTLTPTPHLPLLKPLTITLHASANPHMELQVYLDVPLVLVKDIVAWWG